MLCFIKELLSNRLTKIYYSYPWGVFKSKHSPPAEYKLLKDRINLMSLCKYIKFILLLVEASYFLMMEEYNISTQNIFVLTDCRLSIVAVF